MDQAPANLQKGVPAKFHKMELPPNLTVQKIPNRISSTIVWATELSLAAIGLVFPALVLGYKSFNCSMYQVPVSTLTEKFV